MAFFSVLWSSWEPSHFDPFFGVNPMASLGGVHHLPRLPLLIARSELQGVWIWDGPRISLHGSAGVLRMNWKFPFQSMFSMFSWERMYIVYIYINTYMDILYTLWWSDMACCKIHYWYNSMIFLAIKSIDSRDFLARLMTPEGTTFQTTSPSGDMFKIVAGSASYFISCLPSDNHFPVGYINIHIYVYTHICIYIHIYIYTHIHTYIHAYIHTYVRTYIYIYIIWLWVKTLVP